VKTELHHGRDERHREINPNQEVRKTGKELSVSDQSAQSAVKILLRFCFETQLLPSLLRCYLAGKGQSGSDPSISEIPFLDSWFPDSILSA
jgi:hypothetical protein